MSERAARGLTGHLHLVCAADAHGRSYLRSQSFRAPMHLSKPHEDEGVLVVNVVNPTAGLLSGDRIDCRVRVESGARLLVTTPSASRAHCSPEGHAELAQEFDVEAGGWLDVWPELFIPQGGARYRQRTTLRVEAGGEALIFETLAPGRVAMGEAFAYASLDWETEVHLAGELIARERYHLAPESESVRALQGQFATGYYASCFVISPMLRAESPCWRAIHELHDAEAWIGCSPLRRGGWVIKVVAAGSVVLRRKLGAIRRELYAALGRREPSLRRAVTVENEFAPTRKSRGFVGANCDSVPQKFFRNHRPTIMKSSTTTSAVLFSALTFIPTLAHAHPGHGSGFAAGVAHPLMGLDHVLAMVAVGLWAAQLGGRARWAVPVSFVGMMTLGSALGMAGLTMPMVDSAILCSVMILGLLITSAARLPLAASVAMVGMFAIFHGLAHGAEIPPTASGLAYTGGFAFATIALHVAGFALAAGLQRFAAAGWVRVAGVAVAIGGVMLAAH